MIVYSTVLKSNVTNEYFSIIIAKSNDKNIDDKRFVRINGVGHGGEWAERRLLSANQKTRRHVFERLQRQVVNTVLLGENGRYKFKYPESQSTYLLYNHNRLK